MATIVYNGSTNNWSSGSAWVGGIAPTANDTVLIGTGTGGSTTGILTCDGTSASPNLAGSIDCTNFTGTLILGSGKELHIGGASLGSLKLVSGMTFTPTNTSTLKFVSTTTGNQVTWGTKNLPGVTFDGVGGGWQFQDVPGASNTSIITLTNGALDTNGKNVTANFSSSNSNTRSLTLGVTTWNIVSATGVAWDITTSTGMTLNAGSSKIILNASLAPLTFAGGGLIYGTVSNTGLSGGTVTILGSNTFGALTLSVSSGTKTTISGYALTAGTIQTVTGTFTANGNTTLLRNFIYSTTVGIPAIISATIVSVTHTDFRDITGSGSGSWDFSGLTTTANGDAGGNSGITFTMPKNCYMKTGASANWSGNNWFSTSGGSTHIIPSMPLVHDSVFFDGNSITAAAVTITLDEPRIPSTIWSGSTNTPAFATPTTYEIYGSLILISGMTHTGSVAAAFMGRGIYTLDGGTLTWPTSSTITVNAPTGTLSLTSNFNSSSALNITKGTFTEAGFTASFTGTITINGGTLSLAGNGLSQTGGALSIQFGDINGNNHSMTTGAGIITFAGGAGGSYTFG